MTMIHYMPFTYISEPISDFLTSLLGRISIFRPLEHLVPAHMRTAIEKGLLQLDFPSSVDPAVLAHTLKAFTAWAELHKDRGGDLAGFFSSERILAAGSLESARQIRTQIRSLDRNVTEHPSPLLQDALFLCLAHTFDQQQDAMNREMRSVSFLEQNLGQILGEPEEERTPLEPSLSVHRRAESIDPGLYMTERRIDAWARLAAGYPVRDPVFITTSRSIWESLCERLPEAAPVLHGSIDPGGETTAAPTRWRAFLSELSQAQDPRTVSSDLVPLGAVRSPGWALTVKVLNGCPPHRMLRQLSNTTHEPDADQPGAQAPLNTILGYLQIDSDGLGM
jgi:hypothetical protein